MAFSSYMPLDSGKRYRSAFFKPAGTRSRSGAVVGVLLMAAMAGLFPCAAGADEVRTIPHLQAKRLSGTSNLIESYSDRAIVIPRRGARGQALQMDGRLEEPVWNDGARLGDFVTIWDADPAWSATQVRAFHDGRNLYLGIRCEAPLNGPRPSDRIELVIRPAATGDVVTHLFLTAGGASGRVAAPSGNKASKGEWTAVSVMGDDHWSAEVSIPFDFLGAGVPARGEAWGMNIRRNRTPDFPASAWMALRRDKDFSNCFADVFFGGEASTAVPGIVRRHEFRYESFTRKNLSLHLDGPMPSGDLRLIWVPPDGGEASIKPSQFSFSEGVLNIDFEHPAPLSNGIYRLDVRAAGASESWLARLHFDREALIRGGAGAQHEILLKARRVNDPVQVKMRMSEDELQRLLAIIPDKKGIYFGVYSPAVPHDGRQPWLLFDWDPDDPFAATCKKSGVRFPNQEYPTSGVVKVRNQLGEVQEYPYITSEDGRRCFVEPHIWWLRKDYMVRKIERISRTDPVAAARLLLRFAEVYPGYVPSDEHAASQAASQVLIEDIGPPYPGRVGVWRRLRVDLALVSPLAQAFERVRQTTAFEDLGEMLGIDAEFMVEYHMLRPSVEFMKSMDITNDNMEPTMWRGMVNIGKALGEPDYLHEVADRILGFMDGPFLLDGFYHEVTLSYHQQSVSGITGVASMLDGWSDPAGYTSPRTGTRFDNANLSTDLARLQRSIKVASELSFPDGGYLPIQDTWATSRGTARDRSESVLYPAAGIARLSRGQGPHHSQAYLTFAAKYGHNHSDPLNLVYYALGHELLPDLGYTHSHYRAWTFSTLGHNTVVVDGRDMDMRAGRHGGRTEVFAPVDESFQVVAARQENAYPGVAGVYMRELWLIGTENEGEYLLDLFRVNGGQRHEYTLSGDANSESRFVTDMKREPYGPYLLPPGTRITEPVGENDFGSAGGHYYAYMFVRNVERAVVEDGQYHLELWPGTGRASRLRVTGLVEPGVAEVFFGEAPSMVVTRTAGRQSSSRNISEIDTESAATVADHLMPKLVVRREGTNLASNFITVMEPYANDSSPVVEAVERLKPQTAGEGDIVLEIRHGNTRDIVLSSAHHPDKPIVLGDIEFVGRVGFIRIVDGEIAKMHTIGASLLRKAGTELASAGTIAGNVLSTQRKLLGHGHDGIVVDQKVPGDQVGAYVVVTHPDGITHGYRIEKILDSDAGSLLVLDMDPGFSISTAGDSKMAYFPFLSWEGPHKFKVECRAAWTRDTP